MVIVPNSILLMVLCCASGSKPSWTDALLELSMEGGLGALPVIEPSGSDVEISVDPSTQCGFMVDLGLSVLVARWFAAVPFPRASLASVVAAFGPCGPAFSLESWRHPGYFSSCFQPCFCVAISCVWDVQDLEGLVDALLGTPAAATMYMDCKRNKFVAAAASAAFDVLDFCDGDFVDLVGDLALFSSLDRSAAAFVYEYCECGKLAVAAAAAATIGLLGLFEAYFPFFSGRLRAHIIAGAVGSCVELRVLQVE